MQNTVNERLKFLIDTLESGVPARFAKKLGVAASVIGNYMPGSSREGEPSFSVLQKLAIAYPQINTDWLVNNKGEPFKQDKESNTNSGNRISGGISAFGNHNQAGGTDLQAEVNRLLAENELLKRSLKDKETIIELMKKPPQ